MIHCIFKSLGFSSLVIACQGSFGTAFSSIVPVVPCFSSHFSNTVSYSSLHRAPSAIPFFLSESFLAMLLPSLAIMALAWLLLLPPTLSSTSEDFRVHGLEEVEPAFGTFEGEMFAGLLPVDEESGGKLMCTSNGHEQPHGPSSDKLHVVVVLNVLYCTVALFLCCYFLTIHFLGLQFGSSNPRK
jgi:hypothetical protein